MALRGVRGSRLRRAARGRAGFVALACALYLAGGVAATWPAIEHARTRFLAGGAPGYGEAAAGDHLQTGYRLWLVGHQLEHGRAPWRDPYSFQPEARPRVNFEGWPFGLPYWPLAAAFGPVLAWNLFVLLAYVGAGGLACAWLRELGLPRGAALAGGLAFAIAPYRVNQSVGHLLGPISMLLPAALFAFERGRRGSVRWLALAGAALASVPLSGQVHLALGAIPFFLLYALCRTRDPRLLAFAGLGALAAVGAGLLVREAAIAGSIETGGRSLKEVAFYSAQWPDLWTRRERHGSESFVFLGWATPVLAAAGLALLVRARRYALAGTLAVGVSVPTLLALGTNLPLYAAVWRLFSPLRYPRVPERLMPIACLALAALVGFAAARLRWRVAAALLVALLLVDLHIRAYGASAADAGNRAYAALLEQPPGRLLELPVFLPDVHFGSVYLYYDLQARRERPGGYSTLAPRRADEVARRLERLNCGDWGSGERRLLERLGVRYVTLHLGLYTRNPAAPDRSWLAWRGLVRHGFHPVWTGGAVTLFAPGRAGAAPPGSEPRRDRPVFCQGWYRDLGSGRPMSKPHAPFWIYGAGRLRLRVSAPAPLAARFVVDGRRLVTREVSSPVEVELPLRGNGWHLVAVEVPRLVRVAERPVGLSVLRARLARSHLLRGTPDCVASLPLDRAERPSGESARVRAGSGMTHTPTGESAFRRTCLPPPARLDRLGDLIEACACCASTQSCPGRSVVS